MKKKIIYRLMPLMCCCIMTGACDVPEYSEQEESSGVVNIDTIELMKLKM